MIIKTNGRHKLTPSFLGGDSHIAYVSGIFGTATLTLGYFDKLGQWVPLEDGTLTSGSQNPVKTGAGITIYAEVVNADINTNIAVELTTYTK